MATKYDPDLLQTYADRLYRQANWLIGWRSLLGFLAGWGLDAIVSRLMFSASHTEGLSGSGEWLLPLIGLAVGLLSGLGKAYQLKLDAQRTLCQLQIERNTRPTASLAGAVSA